jgi:hypothetical protein
VHIVSMKQNMGMRALASAVILQAIEDYQATSNSSDKTFVAEMERNRRSARSFLHSNSDRVYGFVWLCQQLDMDHERIRSRIESPGLIAEMRCVRSAQDAYARSRISESAYS